MAGYWIEHEHNGIRHIMGMGAYLALQGLPETDGLIDSHSGFTSSEVGRSGSE